MRITIILIIFLLSNFGLKGQEPNIVPPNPEARSIMKFEQVPVNLHSGLIETSVPIYQLETKSLTIPISLNYHSRGNRVSEIASRVGLGWTLNAGGLITRQIKSGADDGYLGYLNNQEGDFYSDIFTNRQTRNAILSQLSNWLPTDLEPDMFVYSYPKGSGKFIIDQLDGHVLKQKFTNEEITYQLESTFNSFKIVDSDGNKYYFGKYEIENENTIEAYSNINTLYRDYITVPANNYHRITPTQDLIKDTWYLLRITTNLNEEILFEYENEYQTYYERLYDGKFTLNNINNPPIPLENNTIFSIVEKKQAHIKQLSKIKYNNTVIDFIRNDEGRKDLLGGHALERIVVRQTINNQEEIIKEVELIHEYTTSITESIQNINTHFINNEEAKKRLFLKKVVFNNINSIINNEDEKFEYSFTYDSTILPSRISNSVDRWGYFNNKNNGQYLIEEELRPNKRDVNPDYSGAGLLKSIKYPTGGVQLIEYEQNTGYSSFPIGSIILSGGNQYLDEINVDFTLSELDYNTAFINGVYLKTFTINNIGGGFNKVPVRLNSWVSPSVGCGTEVGNSPPTGYTVNCPFLMSIQGGPNNTNYHLVPGNRTIHLFPGTYTMRVIPEVPNYEPLSMDESFYVNLNWDELPEEVLTSGDYLLHGPGKRIKRTELINETNNYEVEYFYEYEDGNSSGLIFGHPDYYFKQHRMGNYDVLKYNRQGENVQSAQNNEIGYEFIQTLKKSNANNSKIKSTHLFTNTPDTGDFYEFPFHSATDNSWLRGHLIEQKTFESIGSEFYPKQKVTNSYNYGGNDNLSIFTPPVGSFDLEGNGHEEDIVVYPYLYQKTASNFRFPLIIFKNFIDFWGLIACDYDPDCPDGEDYYYHTLIYGFGIYHFTGGTMDLVESKTIDYHEDGLEIETISKSEFDYSRNYNPVAIKQITSLGDSLGEKFYYPKDLLNVLNDSIEIGKMQQLIDENRIGSPVKTESLHNNVITASSITKFDEFTVGDSNLLLPSESFSAKGSEDIENFNEEHRSISYDRYDDKGNVLQYTIENATPVSIIWGYNGKYPVAKIEGLSYNDIPQDRRNSISNASNLDNSSCVGYSGCNEATLRNHQKSLRAYLGDAMITTYTYDPLVGVTSITPPNGQTAYYEYDGFGRLKSVKDEAGNIVQDIQYHYRSQE